MRKYTLNVHIYFLILSSLMYFKLITEVDPATNLAIMSVTTARRDEESADVAGVENITHTKNARIAVLQLTDMKKNKLYRRRHHLVVRVRKSGDSSASRS